MDLLSIELDFYIEDETRKFYILSYSIGNIENLDYGYILEECRAVYLEEFK